MKKEEKERRRTEAAERHMPVTVLMCIVTCVTLLLEGLEGAKTVKGIHFPAIDNLSEKDATWTKRQAAKIARWACATMEKHGFKMQPGKDAGIWKEANRKCQVLGKSMNEHLPEGTCYGEAVIAQLAVLECVWRGVMALRKETSQEAIWLRTTMTTMTEHFVKVESPIDWAITDTYMEVSDYLTGQA